MVNSMNNMDIQVNNAVKRKISFACIMLSGIFFVILGVLPKVPSDVTRLFRPAFIALCIVTYSVSRYYRLGSQKIQVINLLYYSMIFISFPISGISIEAYISNALFIMMLLFASNRQWSGREIKLIFLSVIVACSVQAIVMLMSNPNLLKNSGSSHVEFFGTIVNRNAAGYAIALGPLCSMLMLLYDIERRTPFKRLFYLTTCLLCSATVFAIGCRGAFLSDAIGLACIIWQKTREGRSSAERFRRRSFAVILMIAVLFTAMSVSHGTYSERLFQFGEDFDDSGRAELWDEAWELIDAKPLFGGGFDYWEATGHTMGTHNTFLTFMVSTGWVGGILLGLFLLAALIEMLRTRNLVPIAFMAEVFFHSWAEPGMDYYAYIPLVLAYIVTRYLQYQRNDLRKLFG